MTTATTISNHGAEGDQCVVLHDIDWKGYRTLLRLRGERRVPRMVYLDGSSCSCRPRYSMNASRNGSGLFVMEVVVGARHPLHPGRLDDVPSPDEARRRRGGPDVLPGQRWRGSAARTRSTCASTRLPTWRSRSSTRHDADEAVEVYRRFGVPEVWICDENRASDSRAPAERSLCRVRVGARPSRS